jgi:hypothetical protein
MARSAAVELELRADTAGETTLSAVLVDSESSWPLRLSTIMRLRPNG